MKRHRLAVPALGLVVLTCLLVSTGSPQRAAARVLFDFEGPYILEEGRSLKDHALVRDGDTWHIFYIRGLYYPQGTSAELSFGHATSADLRRWDPQPTVLPVEPGTWNDQRVWAPMVIPSPSGSGWTMLYTGVTAGLVQRMGRADSPDLFTWSRAVENPILSPDPSVYYWGEDIDFLSAFRDPFVFWRDGQYHALNTVLLRDPSLPFGYRGAVHHAVSPDLTTWSALAPLAVNQSTAGGVAREIESCTLVEVAGGWNLFFTYSNLPAVRWMRSTAFDSGWNFDQVTVLEENAIAAELTPLDDTSWIYTRYSLELHGAGYPDPLQPFFVIRADTLRFDEQGVPSIVWTQPLANEWPERIGTAFATAPIFGDNALERGEAATRPVGHGYLSSREAYEGPLTGVGVIGDARPLEDTGRIHSVFFQIGPTDSVMTFLLAGSADPGARLELVERVSAVGQPLLTEVRRTQQALGNERFETFSFDLTDLRGATVRLELVDETTTGWVALDFVQVFDGTNLTVSAPSPIRDGDLVDLRAFPNPFNPRTQIEFELGKNAAVTLEIVDVRGRRVRTEELGMRPAGTHAWGWDGTDEAGRAVASGAYLVRASTAEGERSLRAVLVR
jgi:hypothetical protein